MRSESITVTEGVVLHTYECTSCRGVGEVETPSCQCRGPECQHKPIVDPCPFCVEGWVQDPECHCRQCGEAWDEFVSQEQKEVAHV